MHYSSSCREGVVCARVRACARNLHELRVGRVSLRRLGGRAGPRAREPAPLFLAVQEALQEVVVADHLGCAQDTRTQ